MYRAEIFEEGGLKDAPEIFVEGVLKPKKNDENIFGPISKILRFTITNDHLDAYA